MDAVFRKIKPERKCTKVYSRYNHYKGYLRSDFNKRCGYCDDLDIYAGGKMGYQIDHFKPQKHFPNLINEYSNLVYACPYCNRSKWDKWDGVDSFVDPCESQYDQCLGRNEKGQIYYKNKQGKYIYESLGFNRRRHELIWVIERLREQKEQLKLLLKKLSDDSSEKTLVLYEFMRIQVMIDEYYGIFCEEI